MPPDAADADADVTARYGDVGARYAAVLARVAAACARVGRDPAEVEVIAISKRHPAAAVIAARAAGVRAVGENYAQEMSRKRAEIAEADGAPPRAGVVPAGGSDPPAGALDWHFIGALQRNKVKLVVGAAALIHAVDSARLAGVIDAQAAGAGVVQPVLIAVSLAGEAQKSGVQPEDVPALLAAIAALPRVSCRGLMCMPPWPEHAEDSRPYFRRLRALRDDLATPEQPLSTLSMGTTGDFEVAVEEGATLVRVGTAVFGSRPG